MEACELSIIKYILFAFNLLFAVRDEEEEEKWLMIACIDIGNWSDSSRSCRAIRCGGIQSFHGRKTSGTAYSSYSGRDNSLCCRLSRMLRGDERVVLHADGRKRTNPARWSVCRTFFRLQFALCLLIILIVELAVGIAAAVYRNDFEMTLKDILKQSLNKYNDNKSDKIAWNNVQTQVREFLWTTFSCGQNGRFKPLKNVNSNKKTTTTYISFAFDNL